MRIITGSARGINLITLDSEATRPTAERVKEALFSMLQFEVEGRNVLDLFAGSGQLGLEALSRGAKGCTFIDESREAAGVIMENAKKAKLFDRCRISVIDYKSFIRGAEGREKYDTIFLDPPYASAFLPDALMRIADGELLAVGGKIVCETDNGAAPSKRKKVKNAAEEDREGEKILAQVFGNDDTLAGRYTVFKTALYGRVRITILETGGGSNA